MIKYLDENGWIHDNEWMRKPVYIVYKNMIKLKYTEWTHLTWAGQNFQTHIVTMRKQV